MSRGTPQSQDDLSSEWLLKKLEELRRLLREAEPWPETGNQLLSDLSLLITSPRSTSPDEDYEMLSIVVNDALIGIDIMKKYPAFYARMLVDEDLRTAFLDTLELLEESDADEIPEYSGSDSFDLEMIKQVMSRPLVIETANEKLKFLWRRTAEQLQAMFYVNSLKPIELHRSGDYHLEGGHITILHSQFEIEKQELEIRLEASHALSDPDIYNLMLDMVLPDDFARQFEASVVWGDYQAKALVSQYGLANLTPIKTDQILTAEGELRHGLELELIEVN